MLAGETKTLEPPVGFARPEAEPLGDYFVSSLLLPTQMPSSPTAFTLDEDPGPPLDQIAPAPPETRDPNSPFEIGHADQIPSLGEWDPEEPIVTGNGTEEKPTFAPPTGEPVVAVEPSALPQPVLGPSGPTWGSNVHGIARPGVGQSFQDPYAQQLAAMRAQGSVVPAGATGGLPAASATGPWGPVGRSPVATRQAVEAQYRVRYWAAGTVTKLGLILSAIPWPVLLILLVGSLVSSWIGFFLCFAWIIASNNAKVARLSVQRWLMAGVMANIIGWFFSTISNQVGGPDIYVIVGRLSCALLIVVLPIVVWRELERPVR